MSSCCSGAILYRQVYLLNSNVVYTNHVKFSSDTAPLKSLFHFTSSEYLNTLFQAEVRARFWDSSGIYTVSHDFNSSGS